MPFPPFPETGACDISGHLGNFLPLFPARVFRPVPLALPRLPLPEFRKCFPTVPRTFPRFPSLPQPPRKSSRSCCPNCGNIYLLRGHKNQPCRAPSAGGSIVAPWRRCRPGARRCARLNNDRGNESRRTRFNAKTSGTAFPCSRRRQRGAGRRSSCCATTTRGFCGNLACTAARRSGCRPRAERRALHARQLGAVLCGV